jgi:diaminohydroxyphosphoribosylaminopyrimidine deaminase/5-amino-6-(5-phosphoribosylamino)uracil reductase
MTKHTDQKFISYALNLAKKNLGTTSPNPVVGCVITKNNEIISTGVTARDGRPHAEKIAIDKVLSHKNGSQLLQNSSLYVTLEPCSHFGKTAPCADLIIQNRISRVVIASKDPDSRVNGDGIKKLRDAGIEVVVGIMEKESQELNKGFFKAKKTGLPYVTLKLATSLDGKIATKNFDSKWITSEKARHFSHHLRATNDAIMVGSNTARKDNPMLDCRISGLEEYSPKRVIVAGNINFDEELKIFQTAKNIPTIILTYEQDYDFTNLKNLGVEVIFCQKINDQIDLKNALQKLYESGINSVLVEGGQNLATQLLKENVIDELIWIRNRKIIGDDGISGIGKMEFSNISETLRNFIKKDIFELEEDLIEILVSPTGYTKT